MEINGVHKFRIMNKVVSHPTICINLDNEEVRPTIRMLGITVV